MFDTLQLPGGQVYFITCLYETRHNYIVNRYILDMPEEVFEKWTSLLVSSLYLSFSLECHMPSTTQ